MSASPALTELMDSIAAAIADRVAAKLVAALPPGNRADDRLLTEVQFAQRSGLSRKTLQSWRARRKGPRFEKFGRAIRYPEAELGRVAQWRQL